MNTFSNCNNSLSVVDFIKFGNYFINEGKNKEPIEWRVLEVSNNKAFLITKDAIDCKPYNEEQRCTIWAQCTLRQWLNNEFINQSFSAEEQNKIILTNLSNQDVSKYGTNGGNATQDKIFLLSVDEVKKYFNDDKDRKCKATGYAKQQGVYTEDLDNCFWWLRSTGCVQLFAACVYINGGIRDSGQNVCYDHYAVRPALWINL